MRLLSLYHFPFFFSAASLPTSSSSTATFFGDGEVTVVNVADSEACGGEDNEARFLALFSLELLLILVVVVEVVVGVPVATAVVAFIFFEMSV